MKGEQDQQKNLKAKSLSEKAKFELGYVALKTAMGLWGILWGFLNRCEIQ